MFAKIRNFNVKVKLKVCGQRESKSQSLWTLSLTVQHFEFIKLKIIQRVVKYYTNKQQLSIIPASISEKYKHH